MSRIHESACFDSCDARHFGKLNRENFTYGANWHVVFQAAERLAVRVLLWNIELSL